VTDEHAEQEVQEVDELAALTQERDDYLDRLQRLKAEFDNYRKRAARDQ
jgi:molecular chaperone GrpE